MGAVPRRPRIETPALEIRWPRWQSGSGGCGRQVEAALARLRRDACGARSRRLEGHLAGAGLDGRWDRFTVADINMAEMRALCAGAPDAAWPEFPKTTAWLEACQSRPAFQRDVGRCGRPMEPA
jgi:glutathione S-transferase